MKNSLKSQITIFVIIALVIIALIAGFLFLKQESIFMNTNYISEDIQPIVSYIDGCFENSAEQALYILGMRGGVYDIGANYIEDNISKVTYWHYLGEPRIVSELKLEQETSALTLELTKECFFNYSSGIKLQRGEPSVLVDIEDDSLGLELTYPFTATNGESSYSFKNPIKKKIDLRIGGMRKVAEEIAKDPQYTLTGYLLETNYTFFVIYYDNQTILYTITDSDYKLNNKPYEFRLGIKNL